MNDSEKKSEADQNLRAFVEFVTDSKNHLTIKCATPNTLKGAEEGYKKQREKFKQKFDDWRYYERLSTQKVILYFETAKKNITAKLEEYKKGGTYRKGEIPTQELYNLQCTVYKGLLQSIDYWLGEIVKSEPKTAAVNIEKEEQAVLEDLVKNYKIAFLPEKKVRRSDTSINLIESEYRIANNNSVRSVFEYISKKIESREYRIGDPKSFMQKYLKGKTGGNIRDSLYKLERIGKNRKKSEFAK